MATDLNHVVIIGRLTRDVGNDERSFGYVGNGMARAIVSLAVNRSRKGQNGNWTEETSFFDVTIWGKQAENLKQYLIKGTQIAVDGFLKQDRWEKDGQKFSKISIIANSVQLLGGKRENTQNSNNYQANSNNPGNNYQHNSNNQQNNYQQPQQNNNDYDMYSGYPDSDEIPF